MRAATKYRAHCAQYFFKPLLETVHPLHYEMSEDCLYLNIWSPDVHAEKKRTVMVFIHGGGFIMGSSLLEETVGDALAVYGDVVVVTGGSTASRDVVRDIFALQSTCELVRSASWI